VIARSTGARRYLAPSLDLDEFFGRLKQREVSYVVLRWFDDLPHVAVGEDIDLLVADQDLAFVHSLMATGPTLRRTQEFDIYSVSGLPGSDFRGVPYYAPRFAAALLERSEGLRGLYRVPSPQDHYDSLAYHAVYHKGYASGLTDGISTSATRQPSDHDYEAVLTGLGSRLGRSVRPTLESLDGYLADGDLRPPLDTLERLATGNPWIRDRFLANRPDREELWRGLAVFVLRERAQTQVDLAVRELDRQGFEILDVIDLDPKQRNSASHRLRGGNWARGPWPLSGGGPSVYIVAYDVVPDLSEADGLSANNSRILRAKERLRARLLKGVPPSEQYNPVHSSDNPGQALDYLEALGDPDVESRTRVLVQGLIESCAFPYPVVRTLAGHATRAQVAVVQHPVYGPSVCKVFRPGAARFFEREVRARKDLADVPEVPGLIESGEGWLITPLYADDGSHIRRLLSGCAGVQLTPTAARALARFAVTLHERGLFLLDTSTRNLMSDPIAGFKIIDLEFLQEYREPVPDPADAYTFGGVPAGIDGYDEPLIGRPTRRRGPAGPATRPNSAFHPAVTGSSVRALLQPHSILDGPRRALVQFVWHIMLLQKSRYTTVRRGVGRMVSGLAWRRR
jgi:hypothetical protein